MVAALPTRARTSQAIGLLLAALALLFLATSPGCSSKTAEEAKAELEKLKKKEKPKPPFDRFIAFTEPNEKSSLDPEDKENQVVTRAVKPGHWTNVLVQTRANNFDFGGIMTLEAFNSQARPLDLDPRNPFRMMSTRPAALAKGQRKSLESLFYPPRGSNQTWMATRLRNRQGGAETPDQIELLPHMPGYQYYMFVLARDATRYRYLRVLDSVKMPDTHENMNPNDLFYYRVLAPPATAPLALPSQPLAWSSIAYLVWDDVLPTTLSTEQQQALLDWLHWGGGLILSGPQTLDALRGSFLDPYLPASAPETTTLAASQLAELNAKWAVRDRNNTLLTIDPVAPWSGVKLVPTDGATFVPGTGDLVVERRAGRGRVVATAFRLTEPELINWKCYDSFVNGCLLRRPSRTVDHTQDTYSYAGQSHRPGNGRWDSELVTNVRYFTRDAQDAAITPPSRPAPVATVPPPVPVATQQPSLAPTTSDASAELFDETGIPSAQKSESGVGGWNDFSATSNAARNALRGAAGISVPRREFVLKMVGLYLLLIVPVNWLLFRWLGRVEWAWLAVPVIAIGWGAVVIWSAQLDIGFARSETEIAVLEIQGGYSRAHLTRYTALYSSLSTSYALRFDDASAVAQPFANETSRLADQTHNLVDLETQGTHQLSGYPVSSNSTGMVHSEQMFDLGGALVWQENSDEPAKLENNTGLKFSGAAILLRGQDHDGEPSFEYAWLGDLAPGAAVSVELEPYDVEVRDEHRDDTPATSQRTAEGELSLRKLIELAEDPRALAPGEVRLVAWRTENTAGLKGVHVAPAAAQAKRATLVVANLRFGAGKEPLPDTNLRSRLVPKIEEAGN